MLRQMKPVLINCARYGTLFCGAELTQQWYLRKYVPQQEGSRVQDLDRKKLTNMAVFGYAIAPNYMTLFYKWLEPRFPGTAFRTIVTKVAIDQTVLTIPILCMFFPYMSWCEGKEDIFKEFMDKFWLTYMVSCCWWLPAQALNFSLVPPHYRILFNGAAGFVWAFILCIIKRQGEEDEEGEKEK